MRCMDITSLFIRKSTFRNIPLEKFTKNTYKMYIQDAVYKAHYSTVYLKDFTTYKMLS